MCVCVCVCVCVSYTWGTGNTQDKLYVHIIIHIQSSLHVLNFMLLVAE
jgi:hypothetical protein